jgi:predicted Asp-tRNA(Asn)/Glu-tRNA(Gln) amidotransferase subunit C
MLAEKEKQKIQKEARQILEKFGKALENVEEVKVKEEEESESYREEKEGEKCSDDFRKRMFKNAPKHDDDCIIAEKGNW